MFQSLTKEEFIRRSREVHGDKYDYSKVNYTKNSVKVCIICPKHGEFWQTPVNHMVGCGCRKCQIENASYPDNFIKKAREKFGDVMDYSKVPEDYKGYSKKVRITCPIHGEFWQTPTSHLSAQRGCPKCSTQVRREKMFTLEDFIKRAREVHGYKYDYSKFVWGGSYVKSTIICPIHGEFQMSPNAHTRGAGCTECGRRTKGDKIKKTKESFLEKAREVHGDKYDYSQIEYKNRYTPVKIICPEHGEFIQTPTAHMAGNGCPCCGGRKKVTQEEFVTRAKEIHGDKFDYSKSIYKNMRTELIIICPKHGDFLQKPYKHLQGHGCPMCKESHFEKEVAKILKENNIEYVREKRFPFMGSKELDFYLPDYNIAIECQGEQHYISAWGGEKALEELKKRDGDKLRECTENGIKIVYYSNEKLKNKYDDRLITTTEDLLKEIFDQSEKPQ